MRGGDGDQVLITALLLTEPVRIDQPRSPVDHTLLHTKGVHDRAAKFGHLEPGHDVRPEFTIGEQIDTIGPEGTSQSHGIVDALAPAAHLDRAQPCPQLLFIFHRGRLKGIRTGRMKQRIGGIARKDHEKRLLRAERVDRPRQFVEDRVEAAVAIAVGVVADETDAPPVAGTAKKRRGRSVGRPSISLPAAPLPAAFLPGFALSAASDLGKQISGIERRHVRRPRAVGRRHIGEQFLRWRRSEVGEGLRSDRLRQ